MKGTVGIAGAGIAGRLVALELVRRGWLVTLVDRSEGKDGASYAAAGMLSPHAEMETAEAPIAELGLRSLPLWTEIAATCGVPEAVSFRGTISLALGRDAPELDRIALRVGRRHPNGVRRLDASALRALEPGLEGNFTGLYFPQEGYIDNRAILIALDRTLTDKGVVLRYREQELPDSCTVTVDCRGLGAKSDLPRLRGVRGEILRVHAPEVTLTRPVRCAHPRFPVYVVPRPNRHFVIGATSIESEDEGSVTVRSVLELLSTAYALHPAFGEARLVETMARCRPAFDDNLPRLHGTRDFLRVNGLYRHGFLVGPEVARLVGEFLDSGTVPDATLLPLAEIA